MNSVGNCFVLDLRTLLERKFRKVHEEEDEV